MGDVPKGVPMLPLYGWASTCFALVLGLYVFVMRDFLRVFRVYGDDAGVVMNSCLPYFPVSRWSEWLTKGFSEYAVNYRDWVPFGNNTLKPVVNLTFFLEGLLAPSLGPIAFLIASYLAPAVTAAILVFVFHKYAKTGPAESAVLALVTATSALWIGSLFAGVDIVNTFALMFTAATLALLPIDSKKPSVGRGSALLLLQLAAIFSHESAILLPFICMCFLLAFSERRPSFSHFVPFVAAPLLWALARFVVLQSKSSIYALDVGRPMIKAAVYWIGSAVIPIDVVGSWMARGFAPTSGSVPRVLMLAAVATIVLANIAFLGFGFAMVRRWGKRRVLWLIAAFVLATVPHLPTADVPHGERFTGLSMVVGLILGLSVFETRRGIYLSAAKVVLAAQLVYAFVGLTQHQATYIPEARLAGVFTEQVREAANRYKPDRILVVNDTFGFYGVPEMMRFSAWPHRGFETVVLDNFVRGTKVDGSLRVRRSGDELVIETTAGGDCSLCFYGATRVDFDTPNAGFRYVLNDGTEESPKSIRISGDAGSGTTLVVGFDPKQNRVMAPYIVR